jgi:hypothetical protein
MKTQVMEDKPDFKVIAAAKYDKPYVCEGMVDITPAYQGGFEDGAEHVWNSHVLPLQSELSSAQEKNARLLKALRDLLKSNEEIETNTVLGFEHRRNAKELISEIENKKV